DCLLTGVGAGYKKTDDPWFKEMTQLEVTTKVVLDKLAIGDIGGIFLAREESTRERIEDINQRWTGIKEEHIRRCAKEAQQSDRSGVIVVAVGSHKAEIIRECVRLGLVNELIIDYELAKHLCHS